MGLRIIEELSYFLQGLLLALVVHLRFFNGVLSDIVKGVCSLSEIRVFRYCLLKLSLLVLVMVD